MGGKPKEDWEMTQQEYEQAFPHKVDPQRVGPPSHGKSDHWQRVLIAAHAGKPVPEHVLAQYPNTHAGMIVKNAMKGEKVPKPVKSITVRAGRTSVPVSIADNVERVHPKEGGWNTAVVSRGTPGRPGGFFGVGSVVNVGGRPMIVTKTKNAGTARVGNGYAPLMQDFRARELTGDESAAVDRLKAAKQAARQWELLANTDSWRTPEAARAGLEAYRAIKAKAGDAIELPAPAKGPPPTMPPSGGNGGGGGMKHDRSWMKDVGVPKAIRDMHDEATASAAVDAAEDVLSSDTMRGARPRDVQAAREWLAAIRAGDEKRVAGRPALLAASALDDAERKYRGDPAIKKLLQMAATAASAAATHQPL